MTSSEPLGLCCFGAGGHGRVVASTWRAREDSEVVFADEKLAAATSVAGVLVLFNRLSDVKGYRILVTIGDNARRSTLQEQAVSANLPIATFVADPENYFGDESGPGSMVLAGAVVNTGAIIGRGAIINTSAIIEHDCLIGAFAHVSPGACIAGGSTIGEQTWIGAGATVLPHLAIAPHTVIGAGSTVIRTISEPGVYVGSPARRIR